ncbi:MAG: hypothetical protein FJY07_08650, partial [Bacteroidetes bacterium]|nr:hypothetical protein [Bacteroidota bacterium]
MIRSLGVLLLLSLLIACKKEAGEGGTSTVTGKVWVLDFNSEYTHINAEYFGAKEDVYIIYGNDDVYSKSFETSFDGTYRFEHLTKGKYKVFCYSEDTTGSIPGGEFAVIREV